PDPQRRAHPGRALTRHPRGAADAPEAGGAGAGRGRPRRGRAGHHHRPSGRLQEGAPAFKVPALVLREVTERVESLHAGCAKLVGTDEDLIVSEAVKLLDDPVLGGGGRGSGNPYGEG